MVVFADDNQEEGLGWNIMVVGQHSIVPDVGLDGHDGAWDGQVVCFGFGCHFCGDAAAE